MAPIKVFFLDPTNRHRRALRRCGRGDNNCVGESGRWCRAAVEIDIIEASESPISGEIEWPRDDPSWPQTCERCGRAFTIEDHWLVDHDRFYRRTDNGELITLRNAPPGACWDASWYHDWRVGPDGRSLVVICPDGHQWFIDNRCSNCTLPNDDVHRCWVRHGKPEDGTLHVDKNGVTCAAGAGSIQTGKWHGFLHHGELHE
jgi:hypothetical protein